MYENMLPSQYRGGQRTELHHLVQQQSSEEQNQQQLCPNRRSFHHQIVMSSSLSLNKFLLVFVRYDVDKRGTLVCIIGQIFPRLSAGTLKHCVFVKCQNWSAVAVIHEQVLFLYVVLRWSAHAVRTNSLSSHHRQQGRHRHCEVLAYRARPARDGHQVRWKPYSRFVVFLFHARPGWIHPRSQSLKTKSRVSSANSLTSGWISCWSKRLSSVLLSLLQEVHSSSTLMPLIAVMWLRTVLVWLTARWTDQPLSLSSPKMLEKVSIL